MNTGTFIYYGMKRIGPIASDNPNYGFDSPRILPKADKWAKELTKLSGIEHKAVRISYSEAG